VIDTPAHPDRKLLMVAYWYPPAVGAAAERAWAFARHLPGHSWHCRVLTAKRKGPPPSADGVTVHDIVDRLSARDVPFRDYDPRQRPCRLRSCLRELIFPDRFVSWHRSATQPGIDLIRNHRPDLILASFPPASAVALALRLSRETGVPLVLDFRDRWLGPGGYEPVFNRTREKHLRLERDAIAHSRAIIAISDAMADAIVREHNFDRSRVFVIPNGYEPATSELESSALPRRSPASSTRGRLTITHVGTVIPRNRPDLFFESIRTLSARDLLRDVAFRFVGNLSARYLDAAGLARFVQTTGLVSRPQALREMSSADALLLLTGRYVGQWGYNAKLFEYIRAGRPVLCLEESPGSNDRRLLEQFAPGRSFFAPVNNPDAIARAVEALRAYLRDPPEAPPPNDAFAAYSRPATVAKLAACLDSVLAVSI
jgi:glycosyltransferase involved in cell wall biosynthesis